MHKSVKRRVVWALRGVGVLAAVAVLVAGGGAVAWGDAEASTAELVAVVDRIRAVVVALSTSVATLFLTVAGMRWLLAGGDPGQVEGAKRALLGAGIGYGIAILATVLMAILEYVVGDAGGA